MQNYSPAKSSLVALLKKYSYLPLHGYFWILRARALYKVTSDFVDASVNGEVGVINRCIPPFNPSVPECSHMHVQSSILFSFDVESDYEHTSKDQKPDCQMVLSEVRRSPPQIWELR